MYQDRFLKFIDAIWRLEAYLELLPPEESVRLIEDILKEELSEMMGGEVRIVPLRDKYGRPVKDPLRGYVFRLIREMKSE